MTAYVERLLVLHFAVLVATLFQHQLAYHLPFFKKSHSIDLIQYDFLGEEAQTCSVLSAFPVSF